MDLHLVNKLRLHFTLALPWREWQDTVPTQNTPEGPTLRPPIYGGCRRVSSLRHSQMMHLTAQTPNCQPPCLEWCLLNCHSCCLVRGDRARLLFCHACQQCYLDTKPNRGLLLVSARHVLLFVNQPPLLMMSAGAKPSGKQKKNGRQMHVADMLGHLKSASSCRTYSPLSASVMP